MSRLRTAAPRQRIHAADGPAAASDSAVQQLAAIMRAAKSRDALYAAVAKWLSQRPRFAAVGFFTAGENATLDFGPHTFDGPAFDSDAFLTNAIATAEQAQQSRLTVTTNAANIRNVTLISVPLTSSNANPPLDQPIAADVLTAAIVTSPDERADDSLLQLAAANIGMWHSDHRNTELQRQLRSTAATLDLLATIETADNFRSGCMALVNTLNQHLRCRGFVLAIRKRGRDHRLKVEAVAGMANVDSRSSLTSSLIDALHECVDRATLSTFPADDHEDRTALLAHRKLCGELQATKLISHPLKTTDNQVVGAWMAVYDSTDIPADADTLLRVASPRIADALRLSQQASATFFRQPANKARWRWLKRFTVASTLAAAVLAVPVQYRVHCDCAAEPDVRRFIVAPHEGLIEKTFVQSGDVVTAGQLLAAMDGRDVRWELAGLAAEREKAAKEHDSSLLQGDAAAAQRATLELRRIAAREHVLQRRKVQLQVTSPVNGIVLDGHLDRVENAPVTIGQALYEVAELSPVTVEVAIPDDEFSNVAAGFEVSVKFNGIDETFTGTIERIHPRSEIRDADNVFIAEVVLSNASEQLRPGMKGYARVEGETHSLAWNLFHKPWEHLRKSLPF
ncbi:efflux RND transporter periplasmic adaptor subunit [Fuerstiella marisgermanici]|uniref:Efflux transporter, RND family, MFP subunit n=1 Tax=Fuerstiella marisgermanici TaxID=1891926 RepID=A0A1P8WK48_9PLAN|nr:efflux RND transporter periplasmic adaptor subunit [Fuerstiella marisgermanici]APZ94421.1 efflux transporter, RND family, MFP subunit [Fuerstiella marisgermanici]